MAIEKLDALLASIREMAEENKALKKEILKLKQGDANVSKTLKKQQKRNKEEKTPTLF